MFGPLWEVEVSQKCTPLWREAHVEVKMHKTVTFGRLLEVEILRKCAPLWREAHLEVKMLKHPGVGPLFDDSIAIPCRKSARCCGAKHIWKSNVPKTEGFEPLFDVLDVVLLTDKWI